MFITIRPLNMITDRTPLRGIMRVNIDNWYPFLKSLIFKERTELSKSPRMSNQSLLSCKPYSVPDVFQIFKNKDIARLTRVNNSPTDCVIDIFHPSLFFARQPSQEFFRPLCASGLQRLTKFRIMFADMLNLLTRKFKTIRSSCKVINAPIYADRVITEWRFNRFFKNNMDIKTFLSFVINKYGGSRILSFQKSKLIITNGKFQSFESASTRGNRYCHIIFFEGKNSLVKVKRYCFEKFSFLFPFAFN